MLDGRNAKDTGIVGGEIAHHVQLIIEAPLLSFEPNAQREKGEVGGFRTVTLLSCEYNPRTRNLAEPDREPLKRQEELGIRILIVDGIPVLLQAVEGRQCVYHCDVHGSLPPSPTVSRTVVHARRSMQREKNKIRALEPRQLLHKGVRWSERRQHLQQVRSVWPVIDYVSLVFT